MRLSCDTTGPTFCADAAGALGGGRPGAHADPLVKDQVGRAGVEPGVAVDARHENVAHGRVGVGEETVLTAAVGARLRLLCKSTHS